MRYALTVNGGEVQISTGKELDESGTPWWYAEDGYGNRTSGWWTEKRAIKKLKRLLQLVQEIERRR